MEVKFVALVKSQNNHLIALKEQRSIGPLVAAIGLYTRASTISLKVFCTPLRIYLRDVFSGEESGEDFGEEDDCFLVEVFEDGIVEEQ